MTDEVGTNEDLSNEVGTTKASPTSDEFGTTADPDATEDDPGTRTELGGEADDARREDESRSLARCNVLVVGKNCVRDLPVPRPFLVADRLPQRRHIMAWSHAPAQRRQLGISSLLVDLACSKARSSDT